MFAHFKKKNFNLDDERLDALLDETTHTPDGWILEQHQTQLLFVCDEMQRGHSKSTLVSEYSIAVCSGFTEGKFLFWRKKLGKDSFPVAIETYSKKSSPVWADPKGSLPARIKGELYAVLPDQFFVLDKYKELGLYFIRKRINIDIPYRKVLWTKQQGVITTHELNRTVKAWMYIGNAEYWDSLFDAGFMFDPVRLYRPNKAWLEYYYYFSKKDYAF